MSETNPHFMRAALNARRQEPPNRDALE